MASIRTTTTDFTGGLMGPNLRGRTDLDKFNRGARRMRNFLPTIQGPVRYREGTLHVRDFESREQRIITFVFSGATRYLLVLEPGKITVLRTDGTEIAVRGGGTDSTGAPVPATDRFGTETLVPYRAEEVPDVRVSQEVRKMVFAHPKHPPHELLSNIGDNLLSLRSTQANGDNLEFRSEDNRVLLASDLATVGGVTNPWLFRPIEFRSHPYRKTDASGSVLRVSDESERVRLVSTENDFASLSGVDLDANGRWVEYRIGNQWGLARAVEYVSDTEILADPVDSVVNINDPRARFVLVRGDDTLASWAVRDGVPDGETHIRSDVKVFQASHVGSWVRVGGDRLFTGVPSESVPGDYNSQDGNIRWARIVKYRGLEDHPVEFFEDRIRPDLEWKAGSVYEVLRWDDDGRVVTIYTFDGTGVDAKEDLRSLAWKTKGSWRFTVGADTKISDQDFDETVNTPGTRVDSDPDSSNPFPGMIVANMDNMLQFDVVEAVDTVSTGSDLLSPSGTVTLFDLVTDPGDSAVSATHTVKLTASRDFFNASRDSGRYLLGKLEDRWVTFRIRGDGPGASDTDSSTTAEADVDVLDSIPKDPDTLELANNGVLSEFRMGAWFRDNYPSIVSFFEQRRVFASTPDDPDLVWFSDQEDESDFRTIERDGQVLATTGITYRLGTGSTVIRWIESARTMVIGSESGEWQLRPNELDSSVTPDNIRITRESSIGSTKAGISIGASVFFPGLSRSSLYEFQFDFDSQSFVVDEVTKLVPDLFRNDPIRDMAYQADPNSTIWIVLESGRLAALTYRKQDEFYAWSVHDSPDARFRAVTVVPRGNPQTRGDQVWFLVQRPGSPVESKTGLEFLFPIFRPDQSYGRPVNNPVHLDSAVRIPSDLEKYVGKPPEPDAMVVEGAGTGSVNRLYIRNGENDGKPRYLSPDTDPTESVIWTIGKWFITLETGAGYESDEDVATPDLVTSWETTVVTELPLPTVRRAIWSDIDAAGIDQSTVPRYDGKIDPVSTITVPYRLRNCALVVDGVYLGEFSLEPGTQPIPGGVTAKNHVLMGLPYRGELQPNPQSTPRSRDDIYGEIKRIYSIRPYLHESSGLEIGFPGRPASFLGPESAESLFTGFTDKHVIRDSGFDSDETPVLFRKRSEPLTVVSYSLETDV